MNKFFGFFKTGKRNYSNHGITEPRRGIAAAGKVIKLSPAQLNYGCCQSVGKQRDHNEDSLFALSSTFGGENGNSVFGLFIIADGMGGHQFGEVASSTAVHSVTNYILSKYHAFFHQPGEVMDDSPQEIMQRAIQEAQKAVIEAAPGSGTTLTAILIIYNQIIVGHVGDSRAYKLSESSDLDAITHDHTLVKRLEELGQITSEEALIHPQRNILYQAIGQGEYLENDISSIHFPQPGYIILCSDGLWGVVSNQEIKQIINNSTTIQDACLELVSKANEYGGPDNISVIILQLLG